MSDNERKFRHMWRWIAEETKRKKRYVEKFEYFETFGIPAWERPLCGCYACAEAGQRACDDHNCGMMCNYCPIDWGKCGRTEDGNLYDEWDRTCSYEDAAELAEQIAQMEWRSKDERAD